MERRNANIIRVVHVASGDLWAGAEVQICNMIRGLNRDPGFSVQAVLMNEGRLASELRSSGVTVNVLDEQRHGSLRLLWSLCGLLRRCGPHIVHTHRYKENVLGALAARWAGIPSVVSTIHGLPEPVYGKSPWRGGLAYFVDRIVLQYVVRHLIAVSSDIASSVEKVAPSRVSVIANSVCLGGFQRVRNANLLRESLGIPSEHKIVGAVGRLNYIKGMDLFLECAAQLVKTRDNISCLIIGEGPERLRLEEYISGNGLKGRVILTGFRRDAFDLMNLLDVLVISSRHEGLPTVLLEALALGKGVVAAAVGGIADVIQHNVNGLLVPPEEMSSWTAAILFLLDHPDEACRLGVQGQKEVEEKWSVRRQTGQLCEIYRNLMSEVPL